MGDGEGKEGKGRGLPRVGIDTHVPNPEKYPAPYWSLQARNIGSRSLLSAKFAYVHIAE